MFLSVSKVMFQFVALGFQHIVILIFRLPTTSTRFNYFRHIIDIKSMISHKSSNCLEIAIVLMFKILILKTYYNRLGK